MVFKHFTALAWLMGMMVSPEALVLHGHVTGMSGSLFILPLAGALILHLINTVNSRGSAQAVEAQTGALQRHQTTLGAFSTAFLLLSARPAVAVCLATAVLVTAGFVFNEVFLHWFPNFGFAALLLVVLLILNLIGPRVASAAQILFAAMALIGLALLALVGLSGGWVEQPWSPIETPAPHLESFSLAAIAFVGYDLLRYAPLDLDHHRAGALMRTGIAIAGLVFGAWSAAAILNVAPSRLAASSIPHILAAKAIMGPTGRIVMGIVVIAGACAAVNLLLQTVARMTVAMAAQGLMPAAVATTPSRPWPALVAMAGGTGLLMAWGFAGSYLLDVSLRAGLILWLLGMGLNHLAPLLSRQGQGGGSAATPAISTTVRHLTILTIMTTLAGILVYTDEEPFTLMHTIAALVAMAAGLAGVGLIAARRSFLKQRNASHLKKGIAQ